MNSIVAWVADQESFLFKSISLDNGQLLLAYFVIGLLVYMLQRIIFKRVALFLIALLCFQSWSIYQNYKASSTNEVLVLHQTKNPILISKNGTSINIITGDSKAAEKVILDYRIGERIDSSSYRTLSNSYDVHGLPLLIIDSLGIYTQQNPGQVILLTYSPKLNLDRLLHNIKPRQIIADGSNYISYVKRWKETCSKNKVPFHYTGEKGAYYFSTTENQ